MNSSFNINADELATIVQTKDMIALTNYGGVVGIANCLHIDLDKGVSEFYRPSISQRKHHFGSNIVKGIRKTIWSLFFDSLVNSTSVIFFVCAVILICPEFDAPDWSNCIYSLISFSIIMVVMSIIICGFKQYISQVLTTVEKNSSVQVKRDGNVKSLSIDDLVVGDLIKISYGDRLPASGLYFDGDNLQVDNSSLTGDNTLEYVCTKNPFLLAGSKVREGFAMVLVTSVGRRSEQGDNIRQNGEDETPHINLNRVGTYIRTIGLILSLLVFFCLMCWIMIEKALHGVFFLEWSPSDMIEFLKYATHPSITYLCSVPQVRPISMALGPDFYMGSLNGRALLRNPAAFKTIGSVTFMCFDKTGTLTTNGMSVGRMWCCNVVVSGFASFYNSDISPRLRDIILKSFYLNTCAAQVGEGRKEITGSPTESALLRYVLPFTNSEDMDYWKRKVEKIDHFTSFRKKMSVLIALPGGAKMALTKGSPDVILNMCEMIVHRNGEPVSISENIKDHVTSIIHEFSIQGLRTLCFAYKDVDAAGSDGEIPSDGYTLVGVVGVNNPLRPGVQDALLACRSNGIGLCMVTGDNIDTAKVIAEDSGILMENGVAIEGPDFRLKTYHEQKELIPKIQVLASCSPDDKCHLVTLLKTAGQAVVAVVGNGINDVPALKAADIGLAMGSEVAGNADVVILDGNFATLLTLVKVGRSTLVAMQNFFQLWLKVYIICACTTGSPLLSFVQLVCVNMMMNILKTLAMVILHTSDDVMQRQLLMRTNFLSLDMRRNILGQSIYQLHVLQLLRLRGECFIKLEDSTVRSDIFIFNTFVLFQVSSEINSFESWRRKVFYRYLLFLLVIMFVFILQL